MRISQAEEMSTIGSFEGFQAVSLKQEGDDQPSETDHLSMEEEDPMPRQISRQSSVTESTLYPNPYHQPYISRKYFATRPGAIETAMEDLKGHVAETSGETIQGFWLLTKIDHWNNEKERILLVTDKTLLICKYDFIMLSCVQLQRIPLSAVYRICLGKFTFPGMSLDKRQGEGLRIYWGSPEEQSLLSRWNPWSTEVPYATFTEHPMKYTSEKFLEICKLSGFMSKLVPAIQNAHKNSTGSGRGKKLMVLTEPILIETYTGLMSFIGNRNKLGYSLARGSIGF
ncbi:tumor protein p63-regulated gene 1 protein isoform X2 [Homo sapiens]|uniref:tumor protein p63-regulated gene 1 protein isoform X2 n=1 Tax=Homo sapiens TaxID=9606 RepID=UPI000387BEC3|nr:tumor protein p63-regulated gene 1 protein isoform X2 [Homo sapiens]XP_054202325.1 tumor protein p63-regulated gene 1 protein isoform X2 [Homo sapiens]|eukprot:XP_005247439.1 tumor protein p63-regulated gene 1 protein isoform X2 [Homo sapiens]